MSTTIQISEEVKGFLDRMRIFERETYNEILEDLIESNLELNEKTKKEIEEARKSKKWISHEDVKKSFGL
jgi:predicted transcriptional regulator